MDANITLATGHEIWTAILSYSCRVDDVSLSVSHCQGPASVVYNHVQRSSLAARERSGTSELSVKVDHGATTDDSQIVKSFEVTNTLADVLLCCISYKTGAEMAIWAGAGSNPPDCLHALFQKISPFLSEDAKLEDMLRQKIGQAFGQSPTRVLPRPVSGKTDNAQSTPAEDLDTEESIAEGEE